MHSKGGWLRVIDVKNLKKSFGNNVVLKGVNEHIYPGEKVVIIGPSGSGKSTFLRCLNLLETPDSGNIYFKGQDITRAGVNIDQYRQKIGMVFQHFNLFNNLTVLNNLTLAPVMLKLKTKEEAEQKEIELISQYQSNNRNFGYNIENGGNSTGKISEEQKRNRKHSGIYNEIWSYCR